MKSNCYAKKMIIMGIAIVICLLIPSCSKINTINYEEISNIMMNSDFCDDMIFNNVAQNCYSASFTNVQMLNGWALGGEPWNELCDVYKELSLELYERSGKNVDIILLLVNPYKTYQVLFATQNGNDITDKYFLYWREAAMLPHDDGKLVSYESVISGKHANEVISLKAKITSINVEASDWSDIGLSFVDGEGNYSSYKDEFLFFCEPENEKAYKRFLTFEPGDEVIVYYSVYSDNSFGGSSILWVDPA